MLRKLLAVLLFIPAGFVFHRLVWLPHECNVTKGHARRALERARQHPEPHRARIAGLKNIEALEHCLERQPFDSELVMLAGAGLEAAERFAPARELYCKAVRHNRSSAEMYLACGRMQLATGMRDEALQTFIRVGEYAGPEALRDIADAELRWKAMSIANERAQQTLLAIGKLKPVDLVVNGGFAAVGPDGRKTSTTLNRARAAADFWTILNPGGKSLSTEIVPSLRRPRGKALEVSVHATDSGIRQVFLRKNRLPRTVVTAWVLARRGTVCLGAGEGRSLRTSVCTARTGAWEKLVAVNESCPAREIVIISASPNGADFIVDQVSAEVAYAAPPCER
jgi:hypothetical protein